MTLGDWLMYVVCVYALFMAWGLGYICGKLSR